MIARDLPFRHLSMRVPWHDTGWTGTICSDPIANGACLRLGRIAEGRDDAREMELAGEPWADLAPNDLPPCSAERAGFMSPVPRTVTKEHPYASWYESYKKFKTTSYDVPPYAADCVPYRWMLRDNASELAEQYQLGYEAALEAAVDREAALHGPAWVQDGSNQSLLLDTFFSAIHPERSLVFVYAKESPLSNDPRRVLIGVGRATSVGSVIPYRQEGSGFGSVLWERIVGHSIRPDMSDGFLLPYHQILALPDAPDPEQFAVFVPDEYGPEFSYASEHVTHDAALDLLIALDTTVQRYSRLVPGPWENVRQWLDARIGEVWDARGPCPGLGAALVAFGVSGGVLLAMSAQLQLPDNSDPWPLVDQWLRDPATAPQGAPAISDVLAKTWTGLPDERRSLLQLLSRLDLTPEEAMALYQPTERAKAGLVVTDSELIDNPYLIYERTRHSANPVPLRAVDRGLFPDDVIRTAHPMPKPSRVDDPVDSRRVRSLVIGVLEDAALSGDSLRPQAQVIQEIRDRPLQPSCPVSVDVMSAIGDSLTPEVGPALMANGDPAYQLDRLASARSLIAKQVNRRRKAAPLKVTAEWRAVIDRQLGPVPEADDGEETLARQEKASALEVLATSRFSVLVGPAGTGKTTLLRALSTLPEVIQGGVLLLAPTGKARVRMQEAIGRHADVTARTLAQLLVRMDRYDPETGRYKRSQHEPYKGARTVIVDESSMLTEDALDALLDGLAGVERLILVGDPRQLPPIGVGRPFVDIVTFLRREAGVTGFPAVGPSYAELTIPRRQVGTGIQDRSDLLLAEWFAGGEPSPGADEVWDQLRRGADLGTITMLPWSTQSELHQLLREQLARSLPEMRDADDPDGFQQSYGGELFKGHIYFHVGAASVAEHWQVLTPVRASGGGVSELNRMLQRTYRQSVLDLARNENGWARRIPRPAGPQEVVYGDKVINVRNASRKYFYPKLPDALEYVANGEIGVITGPFKPRGRKVPLDRLNVEFTTQPGTAYSFWLSELGGDEAAPTLELAYAITIHKAQGSEFGQTFVVLPNPCRLLSRELLYTALTRQRDHITVLYQGDLSDLRQYSSSSFSETAARLTNLFSDPSPVAVDGRFLEEGLIHMTRRGIPVRSKSEVIIADLLFSKGVEFHYEQPFIGTDGSWRSPDFTIDDDTTGTTIYWEHLGMLQRPSYRRRWEDKLAWYQRNGVTPYEAGESSEKVLVTTRDGDDGSISSADIEALINEVLGIE